MTASTSVRDARHIVWDWNGTLLDDSHAVVSAVNTVCTAFGSEHVDLDRWRSVFGRPLLRTYELVLQRTLSERDWARIDVLYHEAYRKLLHTCGLAAGVPESLWEWSKRGGSQSLLSMWFHDELVPLVTDFGLDSLFTRVDGLRDDIGGGPKAAHLREHVRALELDPAEIVLIGDVVDDARAAEQAGSGCALLTTGVMSRQALEATGFPVFDSVVEALESLEAGIAA
ncbi:HAD family hydrolase [Halosaccharopolyspora lacisalsi]|uniref:HAD family hydrolase n=1 Tax=Halosaccharopolyspora lacisalsi TaxID=1000566 RepID=UPI0015FA0EC0|nr:HAD family hydrolase [Halosaccharopolyspora lacisalsi]